MTDKAKKELAEAKRKHQQRRIDVLKKNATTRDNANRSGDHPLWKEATR